jgi:hypothetical protein
MASSSCYPEFLYGISDAEGASLALRKVAVLYT